MAITLWLSLYGYHFMAITLWLSLYGYHFMAITQINVPFSTHLYAWPLNVP
ncbi:hypothetical protein ACX1H5_20400 [Yersinia enterocolitica]|nr:hypothetical protein [Yersinia enterocolitica]